MLWPESWPIRGEDVAFADSAATRRDSTSVGGPPKAAFLSHFKVTFESLLSQLCACRDSPQKLLLSYFRVTLQNDSKVTSESLLSQI